MKRFYLSLTALLGLAALLSARPARVERIVAPAEPVPADFFGMHIHRAASTTPWPSVPIPAWRLWDAHVAWIDLEPNKGRWNFATLDRYLALAQEHKTRVIVPLALSPRWATARPEEKSVYGPGYAAEPREMDDWRTYVTTVVTHCKGRVWAFEVWNEPNAKGFWTGTTQQMVALTREAREIVHHIDPHALVVSPSATLGPGVQWLTQFLSEGGGQYVDVIGFHFYVAPQNPEAMVPLINQVKKVMADAGVGEKPLWNTEAGWPAPKPFPSEDVAAGYVARSFIVNWAAGVKAFDWYAWDNHGWVAIESTEADSKTLRPAGRAFGVIQNWMVGKELKECDEDAARTWTCELTQSGNPQWIVWNESATPVTFAVPAAWHIHTMAPLLGERQSLRGPKIEIGQVPVLLTD
jgi:hypothetical protein